MHLLFFCSFLTLLGVYGDVNVDFFAPNFKDPYSGTHDALLDIDVQLPLTCINTLKVVVDIPLTSSGEANAHFQGPMFTARSILGVSTHNNVPVAAAVDVAWDGISKMTFSNFLVSATGTSTQGVGWINFNFDIPDTLFNSPTALNFVDDPTKVPLDLVYDSDYPQPPAKGTFINLVFDQHFTATTNDPSSCGNAGGHGDPVFSGFQGQQYQFHGLPDEHFNLVSSPDVSLNAHFVYLSSGQCYYNDTECYTHPGTYMDVLGLSVGETHIKLVAGTHETGLRVWVNDKELHRGTRLSTLNTNITASLRYHHNGRVEIRTEIMSFEIINSDMFMNIRAGLNDQQLLRVGSKKHTVTDKTICKINSETHDYQLVEQTVAKKYPVNTPLHGLIGQTWRNVKVCSRDWMGTVQDYLVSDLFANDNHYNYFKW